MKNKTFSLKSSIDEDISLINSTKNGDDSALKLLIDKHSGICVDTYKRFVNLPGMCGFISDEIKSSKDYIIYNSAKTYDPTMGSKFSTWLANQTRYFCLNCINKNNKLVPTENEDLLNLIDLNEKKEENSIFEKNTKAEILELINETIEELKNKNVKNSILKRYFSENCEFKTHTDISKEMGVTVQTIINWHKKFVRLVRQKCKNRKILFDF
jgi:RNA polymerase sigma factor (sigma-70 family)